MRTIAGSILVLAAAVCILAASITRHGDDVAGFVALVSFIPFALGVYFLFSKDKPGA